MEAARLSKPGEAAVGRGEAHKGARLELYWGLSAVGQLAVTALQLQIYTSAVGWQLWIPKVPLSAWAHKESTYFKCAPFHKECKLV